jgi:hypothetical protein
MIRTTSFLVVSSLAVISPFASVAAQNELNQNLSPKANTAVSLKAGDVAPALRVTKWSTCVGKAFRLMSTNL